jgi:hypothetical protein
MDRQQQQRGKKITNSGSERAARLAMTFGKTAKMPLSSRALVEDRLPRVDEGHGERAEHGVHDLRWREADARELE